MSCVELSLNTTDEAVDWVCTLLAETKEVSDIQITEYTQPNTSRLTSPPTPLLQGEGSQIPPFPTREGGLGLLDPRSSDTQPDLPCPDDQASQWTFTIRVYLHHEAYSTVSVEKIVNLLSPLHRTGIATVPQLTRLAKKPKHTDETNSRQQRIGQRFVLLSADAPDHVEIADTVPLRLKTSLAFGSGLHPATQISLQLLERYVVPTMNVLDLGSGSGILSVAMAKLGATVLALDNDSRAVQATQDAVRRNRVEQQVTVKEGSLGHGSSLGHWLGGDTLSNVPMIEAIGSFDLIVANILARIHIALADDFQRALRRTKGHPGVLITAGFTTDYEQEVTTALTEAGLEVVDCERLNEWVALAYRLV